jgi:hypothetical protein
VPASPMASPKREPPMTTSWPRSRTAASTASIVRGLIVVSTKIAGTPVAMTRSTVARMSAMLASDSVLMPSMPWTSRP